MFRVCYGSVLEVFWMFSGSVPHVFQKFSAIVPRVFNICSASVSDGRAPEVLRIILCTSSESAAGFSVVVL